MKKQQAVNLWRELHDTTEKEAVYRKFDNKSGYGGKRTLMRFSRVDEGLQQAWSLPELTDRTGWSKTYLNKVVAWWQEEFGGDPLIHQGKGPISPLEARSAIAPSEAAERRRKHQELLLATLDTLIGIEPLPMDHTDQMYFYIKPQQTYWPIPKGRIWRDTSGQFAVHLRCEHDCQRSCQDNDVAWACLCQHLEDHPLGSAIIGLKAILARDISDRLQLLAAIEGRASRPREEGGTGLRLNPEMNYNSDISGSGYGPYYLLTILHQSLSRRLKSPLAPKIKEEFRLEAFGTIQLGSYPVIQAADPTERDRAVDWLLEMQDKVADWPKTQAAGESYSRAMAACRNVQRQMDLLQLQGGVPAGSRCDSCPTMDGSQLRDRPAG